LKIPSDVGFDSDDNDDKKVQLGPSMTSIKRLSSRNLGNDAQPREERKKDDKNSFLASEIMTDGRRPRIPPVYDLNKFYPRVLLKPELQ